MRPSSVLEGRIHHGATNCVHRTETGIMKQYRPGLPGTHNSARREVAAVTAARTVLGRRVPRVLAISAAESVLFESLAGVPLSTVKVSTQEGTTLAWHLGDLLGAVHDLRRTNMEPGTAAALDGVRTVQPNWTATFLGLVDSAAGALLAGPVTPEVRRLTHWVCDELHAQASALPIQADHLLHGDFGGANILVGEQTLQPTGLIDWEWALWGDPELDLTKLLWTHETGRRSFVWHTEAQQEAFFAGYGQRRALSTAFPVRYRLYSLWLALSYLNVAVQRNASAQQETMLHFLRCTLTAGKGGASCIAQP